ncbi:MAG TPA: hypothetical protein VEX64_04395 [Pyrinomonadaceae bacterium]|jgi:hypothetical protein|nr:hypothetical protein [Pyrinomonadaceae bacterium]
MSKNVLAVIVGFLVWSILWVGSDMILSALSPVWYAEGAKNFDSSILILSLFRCAFVSLAAGYVAALIAGISWINTTTALGVLLLAFGAVMQASMLNQIPVWYHFAFFPLLIPMTILGGQIRGLPKHA